MIANNIQVLGNGIQFLTEDQISRIIDTFDRNYISSTIDEKIDEIKLSAEYKEQYEKVKKIYTDGKELNVRYFSGYADDDRRIEDLTLDSLYIRDTWEIKNDIRGDIKAFLSLSTPLSLSDITEECKKYVEIDRYLYKKDKNKKSITPEVGIESI